MRLDDPQVQRAIRMGRDRSQQAGLLGVSEATVQRLVHGYVQPFRGDPGRGSTHAADRTGRQINVGDVIAYPRQAGGRDSHCARVIAIHPPREDGRGPRLRVQRTSDNRVSVVTAVQRVKVQV